MQVANVPSPSKSAIRHFNKRYFLNITGENKCFNEQNISFYITTLKCAAFTIRNRNVIKLLLAHPGQ